MANREPPGTVRRIEPLHDELKKLYAYWLEKKGPRPAPSRADLDPLEIASLLPYIALIDVERSPLRFRYRLVGTAIVDNVGAEFTGRYLDTLVRLPNREAIAEEFAHVANSATPATNIWDYRRKDGRHVRYERLVLPLIGDGATVDMLVNGMVFDVAFG